MALEGRGLAVRLLFIYLGAMAFGTLILEADNLYKWGFSLADLWPYNIVGVFSGDLVISLVLFAVTYGMLRRAFRRSGENDAMDASAARALYRLPSRLFYGMIGLALFCSLAFHFSPTLFSSHPFSGFTRDDYLDAANSIIYELSLALTIAIFIYMMSRREIRSLFLRTSKVDLSAVRPSGFLAPLIITFVSVLLLSLFNIVTGVLNEYLFGEPIKLTVLFVSTMGYFVYGLVLYGLFAVRVRSEFRQLLSGMQSLLHADHAAELPQMPVISKDEIGTLAAAFNSLQLRIDKEYSDLQKELQLTLDLQLNLLPPAEQKVGQFCVTAFCRPSKEASGPFYDIAAMPDHNVAVMIGSISAKGMPTALLMSAAMCLFRTEIRQGGRAKDILANIFRLLNETLPEQISLSLAIAVTDARFDAANYAAGINGKVSDSASFPMVRGDKLIVLENGATDDFVGCFQLYEGMSERPVPSVLAGQAGRMLMAVERDEP